MANGEWYYASGGQQQGPVPLDTLRQMLAAGQVQPGDLVWTQGMPNWSPANNVPGLMDAPGGAGAVAPQPQPQPPYGAPQLQYGAAAYPGYPPGQVGYYSPTQQFVYAGFWLRFAAAFIDGLIIVVPLLAVGIALFFALGLQDELNKPPGQTSPEMVILDLTLRAIGVIVGWLYFAYQESGPRMATIGKRAVGIVVTDLNGGRISFGRASGRYFGKILSNCTCYIGYIMAGFTAQKQALHDMIASTLVIRKMD